MRSFDAPRQTGSHRAEVWDSPLKRAGCNRSCRLILHVVKSRGRDNMQSVMTKLRRHLSFRIWRIVIWKTVLFGDFQRRRQRDVWEPFASRSSGEKFYIAFLGYRPNFRTLAPREMKERGIAVPRSYMLLLDTSELDSRLPTPMLR